MSQFKVQITEDTIVRLDAIASHNGALTANAVSAMILTAFARIDPAKLHELIGLISSYTKKPAKKSREQPCE